MVASPGEFNHRLLAVILNDVDGGVTLLYPKNMFNGNSQEMPEDHSVDAAVAEDGDAVLRVFVFNLRETGEDAILQLLEAFPALDVKFFDILEPVVQLAGVTLIDFPNAETLPGTKGELPQLRKLLLGQVVGVGDDFCTFTGTEQVAGVDGLERDRFQSLRDMSDLLSSCGREINIEVTIEADFAGIGGFSMADKINTARGLVFHGLQNSGVGTGQKKNDKLKSLSFFISDGAGET